MIYLDEFAHNFWPQKSTKIATILLPYLRHSECLILICISLSHRRCVYVVLMFFSFFPFPFCFKLLSLLPGDGHLPPTVLQPAALHHLHLTDAQHKPNSTVHLQGVQPEPLNSKRDYPPDQVFVPPHHLALSCQPPPSIHHPAHSPCLLLLCFQSVGNKL